LCHHLVSARVRAHNEIGHRRSQGIKGQVQNWLPHFERSEQCSIRNVPNAHSPI
jgi:hypothetical protein